MAQAPRMNAPVINPALMNVTDLLKALADIPANIKTEKEIEVMDKQKNLIDKQISQIEAETNTTILSQTGIELDNQIKKLEIELKTGSLYNNIKMLDEQVKQIKTINEKTLEEIKGLKIDNDNSTGLIAISPNTIKQNELQIKVTKNSTTGQSEILTPEDIGTWKVSGEIITITTNKVPEGEIWYIRSIQTINRTTLESIPLENIDTMRDIVLQSKGNTVLNISTVNGTSLPPFTNFGKRKTVNSKLNTTDPRYGLCLKTYNSDLFQNWINTEWVEGIQGVNEISAVDVSDGKLSMDALNLSQKVYNMLNRIVVSGGTYRDWLETVYTGSNYFERCETPIFEGGTSQEIVFQEVVSNAASEDEPLGTLAGRGVTTNKQRGGHVKIKVTEPGYIMCISSITPRIDYSQGNDWDTELKNMDDLHKPALDGIGYQDSINGERAWWADYWNSNPEINQTAAGKTVAWINYMTNVNRTFGNFATGMSEEFMVLNRQYNPKAVENGRLEIEDLTTYIDPIKYNYIFADTNLDAMNFWLQIKFDIRARRLISAKQIPNL